MPLSLLAALSSLQKDSSVSSHGTKTLRAKERQTLFHAGDPSDAVYLLLEGEVRLGVPAGSGFATTLLCRGPAVLGDRDLLVDTPSRESATCLTSCLFAVWEANVFRPEYESSEPLRGWLNEDLALRYLRTLEWLRLAERPLAFRAAAVLRDLSVRRTQRWVTLAEVAAVLGTAEKTVQKSIASLRENGAVTRDAAGFRVDPGVLQSLEGLEDLETFNLFHSLRNRPK